MKVGSFNINEYIEKLYEEAKDGQLPSNQTDGIIIPEENKKFFSWLKGEYQKGKVEVKVEMKLGDSKFEPGYNLQTDLKSVKDFKPGMYGQVKTGDTGKKNESVKKTEEPKSPKNNKEETTAEDTVPKNAKEAKSPNPKGDKSPAGQQMKIDLKKKEDAKK